MYAIKYIYIDFLPSPKITSFPYSKITPTHSNIHYESRNPPRTPIPGIYPPHPPTRGYRLDNPPPRNTLRKGIRLGHKNGSSSMQSGRRIPRQLRRIHRPVLDRRAQRRVPRLYSSCPRQRARQHSQTASLTC